MTHQPLAGAVAELPASSVVPLIWRHVKRTPDAAALEHRGEITTFGRLWQQSADIAAALEEQGVRRGDLVGVWATRAPQTIASFLAVMRVGAAYLPLEPTHPVSRIQAILHAARPSVMLHDSQLPPGLAGAPVPFLDLHRVSGAGRWTRDDLPTAPEIAYVVFTSGSSGQPKGVMVSHGALTNYVSWCVSILPANGGGSPLIGSLAYDLSMTSLWPQLARGGTVVLCDGVWDYGVLFDEKRSSFAYAKVTPSMLRFFEQTRPPDYRQMSKMLIMGGEALYRDSLEGMGQRLSGVTLVNHYGPTETTIGCCYNMFTLAEGPRLGSIPIGKPIWNTRAYIVDSSLSPVPPGEPGELLIAGSGVADGYLGGVDGDRFVDESDVGVSGGRAYRTGDTVRLSPEGLIVFIGRDDTQVKVSGHRVDLEEVRRLAMGVPGVSQVEFSVEESDHLLAYVVPSVQPDTNLSQRVRRTLAASLPSAVVPRRVHVVTGLSMNANGKFDAAATLTLAETSRRL